MLTALHLGRSLAGRGARGSCELALRGQGDRAALMANILGQRLWITPIALLAIVSLALLAGYPTPMSSVPRWRAPAFAARQDEVGCTSVDRLSCTAGRRDTMSTCAVISDGERLSRLPHLRDLDLKLALGGLQLERAKPVAQPALTAGYDPELGSVISLADVEVS